MDKLPFKFFSTLEKKGEKFDFEVRPKSDFIFIGDVFDDSKIASSVVSAVGRQLLPRTYVFCSKNLDNMLSVFKWKGNLKQDVWIGCYARTQEEADINIPKLLGSGINARFFVLCKPMAGRVMLYQWLNKYQPINVKRNDYPGLFWVVAGGNVGENPILLKKDWAIELFAQCARARVAMFFIGWGNAKREDEEILTLQEKELFERLKFLPPEFIKEFKQHRSELMHQMKRYYGR